MTYLVYQVSSAITKSTGQTFKTAFMTKIVIPSDKTFHYYFKV